MKKLLLLMLTILLGLSSLQVSAQQVVEILGDGGTTTNSYLPIYTLYNNTLSEQIYTAEEVGMAGTINSIAFFNGGSEKSPNVKIYMINTDKTSFTSTTDWFNVSAADLVFDGVVTFVAGQWTTITFSTPFFYDGVSNLGLIVDGNLSWSSGLACRVFNGTSDCAMYAYDDNVDYDAVGASYTANSRLGVKNQIKLEIIPGDISCHATGSLSISNVSSDNATISWGTPEDAGTYILQCKPSNIEWDDDDVVTAYPTDTTYDFSNILNPNTTYNVRVANMCSNGDTSIWRNVTFTTLNVPVELPFTQNFETDPESITDFIIQNSGPNGWYIGSATGVLDEDATDPTVHALYISNDNGVTNGYNNGSASDAYAVLDVVFGEDMLEWHLAFDYNVNGEGSSTKYDYLSVYLMDGGAAIPTSGAPSGTALLYQSNLLSGWTHFDVILQNVIGTSKRVVFYWRNDSSSGENPPAAVDNISIVGLSCMQPTGLTVSDQTTDGATITWQGDASEYAVYLSGAMSGYYIANGDSYTFTGLNASSTYTVQVRALCNGDSSAISLPVSFNTACDAITVTEETPWVEDFEGYAGSGGQPFVCWATPVTYNASNGVFPLVYCSYGNACHSGLNSAEFKGNGTMMVLPEFANPIQDLRLSFWATATIISVGNIEVGVITDITDPTTFEVLGNAGTPGQRGGAGAGNGNYMGPFDFNSIEATEGRIALRYTSTSPDESWNLDDFTVQLSPDCPSPVKTSVTATNVDAHYATISWVDGDESHNAWTVYYREANSTDDGSWMTAPASETTIIISDLEPETTYEVYVVTDCGSTVDNPDATLTITFTTTQTCSSPSNLMVSQITGTSAFVTWEPAPVGATAYVVAYTVADQEDWNSETVTDSHFMITGLEPQTSYIVTVTSECEEGSAPAISKNFTTHCLAGGDFQIGEGTLSNSYIPSYCLYNYSYTQQIFLASELNGPTTISSVAFHLNTLNTPGRHLSIYLMNTTAESASWLNASSAQQVFDGDVTLTEGWNTFDFTTPFEYDGTNLAVIMIDGTGTWATSNSWTVHNTSTSLSSYVYQDSAPYSINSIPSDSYSTTNRNNVIFGGECDETVTCIAPNVYLSDITAESVTLNWVPGYTENTWEVEYCTDTANWIPDGVVTASPHTIEGLNANTLYTVRMRSVCDGGDYSNWRTLQFRTDCDDIAVLPFVENFDSYGTGTDVYPTCWSRINTYSSTRPYVINTAYTGGGSLYFTASSGTYNIAITPPFTTDIPVNTLQASFMYRASSLTDMLIVGVMTDPNSASTFVPVDTVFPSSTPSSWMEKRVSFDQYEGEGSYIAFKNQYTSTTAYGYIDELVIDLLEECPQPMQVVATSTPYDTVFLSWDGGTGTSWDVIYGPLGFDPDNSEEFFLLEGITDNPYTITELAGGMGYDFYVRTNCGGEVSAWSNFPASAYPFSYQMGVTGADTLAGCGFIITDNGGLNGNYSNNCDFTVVVYPSDPDSLVSVSGTFAGEGTYDKLYIYDGVGTSNQVALVASTQEVTFGPIISESGPLTIRFTSDQSTYNDGFVVVTSCVAAPNCPSPVKNSVTVSNIDGHNATISFVDNNPEHNSWTVYYRAANAPADEEWLTVVTDETSAILTDLDPETTYNVYVITNCDIPDEEPDATNTVNFTTDVACPAPTNVTVTPGMTEAIVSWEGTADSYTVTCGENTITVSENTATLTDLTGSTNYTVSVAADCGYEGLSLATTASFSTAACELSDQCTFAFNLQDSYGDGWNNASISVTQNGIVVASLTIPSGQSSANHEVALCNNADIALVWNSGSYDSECSFTVTDPFGEVVYTANGMSGVTGTLTTFTAQCVAPTCPKPASITVSNINTNSADVSWVSAGSETAWNLEYKESSNENWTVIPVTTNASYTLTGLTALTIYDVRVQADCGNGDLSEYKATSFNTASCDVADQCNYTFILTDTYGDGWNGASLIVKQENIEISVLEAEHHGGGSVASADTVVLGLCDGASTSLEWTSGSYDAEAGFSLIGPDGTELYSITGMSDYSTYTFTTDCSGSGPGPVITNPTVATNAASGATQTTATLNATITNPDNVTVTAKGFEWKTTTGGTYASVAGTGTGNTFTASLTNLNPNTSYTFKAFITYNGTTVYGDEMTFNTLPEEVQPCDVPTGLEASNITKESFTVTWNNNANVSSWNIQYRPLNGQLSSAVANTNHYDFTNLTAETVYQVQVQANCGDGNLSEWSDILTVTTLVDAIESYLINRIALYPNPAKEYVDIRVDENVNVKGLEVYDVYGKLINTVNVIDNPTRINVSGLADGMYFVRVTTEQGVATKTFVKR